jgi:putative acetyltransferase
VGSWHVRSAESSDHEQIIEVVRQAFTKDGSDGAEEVDIVRKTWELSAALPGLELVVADGDRVVGHVVAATADLNGVTVPAVAPLSVVPERQGVGVGSALMTTLLERAEADGWPMVAILGDPAYYGRFGFEPSAPFGIVYPPVGEGSPYFQVRRLSAFDPAISGTFRYCWEQ